MQTLPLVKQMVAEAGGAAVSARDTSARPRPAFRLLNGKLILSSGCGDFIEYRGLVNAATPSFLYIPRGSCDVPGSIRLEPSGAWTVKQVPRGKAAMWFG